MVGLGSNQTSLLERVGKKFEMTLDWLEMDRQERGQARKIAAIKWSMKHKKQQKPVAPVEQCDDRFSEEGKRLWIWKGEDIPSKSIQYAYMLTSDQIRKAGFRCPKLKKKG